MSFCVEDFAVLVVKFIHVACYAGSVADNTPGSRSGFDAAVGLTTCVTAYLTTCAPILSVRNRNPETSQRPTASGHPVTPKSRRSSNTGRWDRKTIRQACVADIWKPEKPTTKWLCDTINHRPRSLYTHRDVSLTRLVQLEEVDVKDRG